MKNEELFEKIRADVAKELECDVVLQTVKKLNDVEYYGLCVKNGESDMFPVIYLNDYINKDGNPKLEEDEIVQNVVYLYKANIKNRDFDTSNILCFDRCKERLIVCICNTENNTVITESAPCYSVADLTVYFRISVDLEDGIGSIVVSNNLMKFWNNSDKNVTVDLLKRIAWENTKNKFPAKFTSMLEVLGDIQRDIAEEIDCDDVDGINLFVLTGLNKTYGAVYIDTENSDALERIGKKLGTSFWILPSSINELVIVPETDSISVEYLKEMVYTINREEVNETERLSDSVYRYDLVTKQLSVAA